MCTHSSLGYLSGSDRLIGVLAYVSFEASTQMFDVPEIAVVLNPSSASLAVRLESLSSWKANFLSGLNSRARRSRISSKVYVDTNALAPCSQMEAGQSRVYDRFNERQKWWWTVLLTAFTQSCCVEQASVKFLQPSEREIRPREEIRLTL